MNNEDILLMQVGFNWLLSQCAVRNQLPVTKPSASATVSDVIGCFCEKYLTLAGSSLVVVVTCYAQDGYQRYPNSSHRCLCMIFDCCETGKRKTL